MSKNKNSNRRGASGSAQPNRQGPQAGGAAGPQGRVRPMSPKEKEDLRDQVDTAYAAIPQPDEPSENPEANDSPGAPEGLTAEELQDLWVKVQAVRVHAEDVVQREDAVERSERQLALQRTETADARKVLEERQAELARSEINAQAGFAEQSAEALAVLRTSAKDLAESVATDAGSFAATLSLSLQSLSETLATIQQDAQQRVDDLAEAARKETSLMLRDAQLKKREEAFDDQLAVEADRRMSGLQRERDALRAEVVRLEALSKELAKAKTSTVDPKLVDAYKSKIADLESRLVEQVGSSEVSPTLLQDLERDNRELAEQLAGLRSERSLWERRISEGDAAQARLTLVEDKRDSLERLVTGYKQGMAELKSQLNELVDRSDARTPFPLCSGLDDDPDLQSPPLPQRGRGRSSKPRTSLADMVGQLQALMASAEEPRFYALDDIRDFLAGMASSRILVLQGLSGTGKTSLPIAIAEAMEYPYEVVEVAAGWRENQDLIGDYNAFDKRFGETKYLAALYRALTPAGQLKPSLIVLDEMNLSHPEHYFSDVLSAMELPRSRRRLPLRIPADAVNLPRHVQDREIPLAENVWFIGTSNRDETTVALADKIYDRSHIMELPVRHPSVSPGPAALPPISYKELNASFEEAVSDPSGAKGLDRVLRALDMLSPMLNDQFDVAWGNRLPLMMGNYVPVMIASGSTTECAFDRVMATKVLRKIEGRYEFKLSDLDALEAKIDEAWPDWEDQLPRSRNLLSREKRRKTRQ